MAKAPLINDVSTDLERPPAFRLARHGDLPSRFVPIIRNHYADLEPLRTKHEPAAVFQAAQALASERKRWRITVSDSSAGHLEVIAITRVLRFRDDVVVRVAAGDIGETVVDMRSTSRLGRGDFGANAARIRAFVADLRQRLETA